MIMGKYFLNKKIKFTAMIILLVLIAIFIYFSKAFIYSSEKNYKNDFLVNKKYGNEDVALVFNNENNGIAYRLIKYENYDSVHDYDFTYKLEMSSVLLTFENDTKSKLMICDDDTLFNNTGRYFLFKL